MTVDTTVSRSPWARISGIWAARKVLALLIRRDLKVRYASSALGYVWAVLDPLLMAGVYWVVFTQIFVRLDVGADPYIVFLVSGLLPWQWFTAAVNKSGKALNASAKLIRAQNLPREIWVLRPVLTGAVEYVFALPVLALFVIVYGAEITWYLALLPVAMLMMIVLLTGIGLLLAPLIVLIKDLDPIVSVVVRLLFYASPIIYSHRDLPAGYEWASVVNPLNGILSVFRSAFFPDQFQLTNVLTAGAVSLGFLLVGWVVFARLERTVLKEI
ncbi:ABC transporter permease [Solicola sp. PLA-1-18]|uniref:ABC transporter permease n=1 Tax=Solicola sp. PLA-1-18 TaxID=3380532 RepID=UPI003B81DA3E